MFADSLLTAERMHLLRVVVWGAVNVVAGTAIVVMLAARRSSSPLLRLFGATGASLGAIELVAAAWSYRAAPVRDFAAAVRLDRMLWLELGLCIGAAVAGAAVAATAWRLARRLAPVGVGLAVTTHALALAVLDLQLATIISR